MIQDLREKDKILVNKIISLTRFIEGGAAMLPAFAIKNQNVIAGNRAINPLVK